MCKDQIDTQSWAVICEEDCILNDCFTYGTQEKVLAFYLSEFGISALHDVECMYMMG
jgi:hypothetical protein